MRFLPYFTCSYLREVPQIHLWLLSDFHILCLQTFYYYYYFVLFIIIVQVIKKAVNFSQNQQWHAIVYYLQMNLCAVMSLCEWAVCDQVWSRLEVSSVNVCMSVIVKRALI